jgi:hypothetical protein
MRLRFQATSTLLLELLSQNRHYTSNRVGLPFQDYLRNGLWVLKKSLPQR